MMADKKPNVGNTGSMIVEATKKPRAVPGPKTRAPKAGK